MHSIILTVCVRFKEASWELEGGHMTQAVDCSMGQSIIACFGARDGASLQAAEMCKMLAFPYS